MADDLKSLIQSRVDEAREKIAELNKAEQEAQSAPKDKVGTEGAPKKGRKVKPEGGYPKGESVKAADLRKLADEIAQEREQEAHVVKLATDLAIEAGIQDAQATREGIKEAMGTTQPEETKEALGGFFRRGGQAVGQAAQGSVGKTVKDHLADIGKHYLGAGEKAIKDRAPVYSRNIIDRIEDAVSGGAAQQASL